VQSLANFFNATGALADPTTIVFKYRPGGGSTTTITYPTGIVRVSTGVYYYNIDTTGFTGPGLLLYTTEWIGTGAVQAPGVDYWNVEPLPI
jgi:hypothetical protein